MYLERNPKSIKINRNQDGFNDMQIKHRGLLSVL